MTMEVEASPTTATTAAEPADSNADSTHSAAAPETSTPQGPTPKAAADSGRAPGSIPRVGEELSLVGERTYLLQQNAVLTAQLAQLQQHHAHLTAMAQSAAAAAAYAQAAMQQQQAAASGGPASSTKSAQNTAWTEQVHPENGHTYYFNSQTGESTYTRPADYNPSKAANSATGLPQVKGPPGANLFVVRKMRKGEYDAFSVDDLIKLFSNYGTVTLAEMAKDAETGWSKGFGFVSLSSVEEADAAILAINNSWVDGREMKVEKTNEDANGM